MEIDNLQRASFAAEALDIFCRETYGGRSFGALPTGDRETAIADLVCDLLHLANLQGFEIESILRQADLHYQAEIAEESEQG